MRCGRLVSIVLILVWASVLSASSEPNACEKLGLDTAHLAGITVHYEKSLEPYLPTLEKAYEGFIADVERRKGATAKKEEILEAISDFMGDEDQAAIDNRRLTFFRRLETPISVERGAIYLITRDTARGYLRTGGELPTIRYDKATDKTAFNPGASIQDQGMATKAFELTIPVRSAEQCAEEIDLVFAMMEGRFGSGAVVNTVANMIGMSLGPRAKPTDPHWNWFNVGVSVAAAQNLMAEHLGPEQIKRFDIDLDDYRQYEKELNLRYWLLNDLHIGAPLEHERELQTARRAYAQMEVGRLIEEHGIECIRKILDEISGKKSRGGEDLLAAIEEVTGEDMEERLGRYQTFGSVKEGIEKYGALFNEASAEKDREKLLINLLRMHEVRPLPLNRRCLNDYLGAAILLDQLGHEREADRAMQNYMELFSSSPEGRLQVMQTYLIYVLTCRKPEKGLAIAKEMLDRRPDNVPALSVQMLSDAEVGRLGKAKETARLIQELVSEDNREDSLAYKLASDILSFDPSKVRSNDPNGGGGEN